ncbi:6-phosphogluconolactonase [Gloeobacter violaceus]|uniref:6-phosphogluconolactonase n=1 Tax=Gloeobacter violaceus (strain ATCC 29082 / PCC 7421) TaxID=251221 RepID=Q7NGI9_GLOVI|nr:6-phosphogluconolactonase [Gloeobacter violaceus]BAC91121.1 6-phosphogluconolactonase [Gloeobacter violaceus PCC 7421]
MRGAITIFPDLESLSLEAAQLFEEAAHAAIALHNRFCVSLAGGSTPKRLYQLLATEPHRSKLPWNQIHLFWGDERFVPPDDPQSNYRMVKEALLDHVAIPVANVHAMPVGSDDIEEAARLHSAQLSEFFGGDIRLDLALMGMGADGHTASLFPGDGALTVDDRPVAAARPASQPTARLTLTYPVFNRSRKVLFLVAGADKAEVLTRVLAGDTTYPSALIDPADGERFWMLDQAAAAKLPLPS